MSSPILETVRARLSPPPEGRAPGGLWASAARLDLRTRRLRLRPDTVVERQEAADGTASYVLKNPARWSYVRLSRDEYELAKTLDGTRTVEACAAYLLEELDIFPFFLVGPTIGKLYSGGFLVDMPPPVFQAISRRLEERSWRRRIHRFLVRTVAFRGLDPLFTRAWNSFARFLYLFPVLLFLHALALAGLAGYGALLVQGSNDLLRFPNGFLLEFPLVLATLLVLVVLHELGHAFTVKWRGRQVDRGGVALAVFVPTAFFVDTSDMWLDGSKRGRIAVEWGGPLATLLGSAAAVAGILVAADPGSLASSVLYKAATVNYLLFFLNLNPLLRTDGHDILADWIGLPSLADRAKRFAQGELWRKLRAGERLGGVEKFLAAYAGFALLWGAAATAISIALLWAFASLVERLWAGGSAEIRIVLALLAAAVALPVLYAAYRLAEAAAFRGFGALHRLGFFRDTGKILALLGAVGLLLVLPAIALHASGAALASPRALELHLALVGALASLVTGGIARRVLRHEWHPRFFRLLLAFAALSGAAHLAGAAALALGAPRAAFAVRAVASPGLGALLAAAASAFRLRQTPGRALPSFAVPVSVLAAVPVLLLGHGIPVAWLVPFVIGALLSAQAAASHLEAAAGRGEGRFDLPFGVVVLGLVLYAAGSAAAVAPPGSVASRVSLALSALGLAHLAGGSVLVLVLLSRIRFERTDVRPDLLRGEDEKMRRAFALFVESALRAAGEYFGPERARWLEREANAHLVSRACGILVLDGRVQDELPASTSLIERAEIYVEIVSKFLDLMARSTGRRFTDRLVKTVYDSLYWDERELVTSYFFRGRRWDLLEEVVPEISADPVSFLRQVPLFCKFADADLDLLHRAFLVRTFRPGEEIVRAGDPGRELYVVQSGIADVYDIERHRVNSVSAFGYFGEAALIEDKPRNATVVARTRTTCLVLGREHFDRLVRPVIPDVRGPMIQTVKEVDLLRRMPVLAHLGFDALADLLQRCRRRRFEPGEAIIRQGEIGREFYILVDGEVVVHAEDRDGNRHVLARRARGESFGEIALLHQIPRTASVEATARSEVLALTREDFEQFLRANERLLLLSSQRLATVQKALEQAGAPV